MFRSIPAGRTERASDDRSVSAAAKIEPALNYGWCVPVVPAQFDEYSLVESARSKRKNGERGQVLRMRRMREFRPDRPLGGNSPVGRLEREGLIQARPTKIGDEALRGGV